MRLPAPDLVGSTVKPMMSAEPNPYRVEIATPQKVLLSPNRTRYWLGNSFIWGIIWAGFAFWTGLHGDWTWYALYLAVAAVVLYPQKLRGTRAERVHPTHCAFAGCRNIPVADLNIGGFWWPVCAETGHFTQANGTLRRHQRES